MVGALRLAPQVGVDLRVGRDGGPRRELRAAKRIERPLREDLARQPDAVAEFAAIAVCRHVVELDPRRLARVDRPQPDPAGRRRAHRADVRLEAVLIHLFLAVVRDRDRQEVVLEVGVADARAAADEAARLEMIGGAEPRAEEKPLDADPAHRQQVLRRVERDRLRARVLHVGFDVVLQVLADSGNVGDRRDVELA